MGALAFLALTLWVPFLRDLFSFGALLVGIASIAWFEALKRLSRPATRAPA